MKMSGFGIWKRILIILRNGGLRASVLFFLVALFSAAESHGKDQVFTYPSPVLSSEVFPCSGCHRDMASNHTRRELLFHTGVRLKGHGEPGRWCLDCHDGENRDTLRLPGGERVTFREGYRLCRQCHGKIYDNWSAGIHGKRTGDWNGKKYSLPCTNCHNPHSPKFKPLAPEPAPLKPEETLRR